MLCTAYALGARGANICPVGYEYIIDYATCVNAMGVLGGNDCLSYQNGRHGANGQIGCIVNTGNNCVHFNRDKTDRAGQSNMDSSGRYMCQRGVSNLYSADSVG